jgi:hypothetical protein
MLFFIKKTLNLLSKKGVFITCVYRLQCVGTETLISAMYSVSFSEKKKVHLYRKN